MIQPKAFGFLVLAPRLCRSSLLLTAAAAVLGGVDACGPSRSSATQTSTAPEAPPPSSSTPADGICPMGAESGYESLEVAFRRYVEAVNNGRWCDAANTFAASARIDLAEVNFKALVLLAGAANPNRAAYLTEIKQFCEQHALDCKDPHWIEQAAADMMTRTDVAPKLADFRRTAADNPAQLYKELMLHMRSVDASVLTKFDATLDEVQIGDGKASGKAKQEDGRTSRINFAKTTTGWLLSVR